MKSNLTQEELDYYRDKWITNCTESLKKVFEDYAEADRVLMDSLERINSSKVKNN